MIYFLKCGTFLTKGWKFRALQLTCSRTETSIMDKLDST